MAIQSPTRRIVLMVAWAGFGMAVNHAVSAAETLWVRADQTEELAGPMVLGVQTGLVEDGAMGDFLVSAVCTSEEELTGGRAEYRVKVPRAGSYYVWARLRDPLGLGGAFALCQGSQKPTADRTAALGAERGSSDWQWVSKTTGGGRDGGQDRLRLDLPAGLWRFRVYARQASDSVFAPANWRMARPMFNPRLNLICLTTDAAYVPTDADARRALDVEPARYDDAEIHVHPVELPPVSDEELERIGRKRVPDWLRCPRFYTKDSWRDELKYRKQGDIAYLVRQVAANEGNALRISCYWSGDAYFQSTVAPHAPGLGGLDYLREAIDAGRRHGVKIVMYMQPKAVFPNHPLYEEAATRHANGQPVNTGPHVRFGARVVCINNPKFRDYLARFLTEVFTEYGPDGLYVDSLAPHRCFCEHCRRKYREMWGEPMPADKLEKGRRWWALWELSNHPFLIGDPEDPDSQRYTQFLYRNLLEIYRLARESVKRAKPDAVTLFHSWPKPETVRFYEGTLTEIYLSRPWKHHLWKFGELANYSNNFFVPVLFNIYLHDHGTAAEARTKLVQGLAGGCYPNCWNLLGMKPVFRLMRENAQCFDFARTTPTRFLALPRAIRTTAAHRRLLADRTSPAQPKRDRFLAPYVGMYSALTRQALPAVCLHRHGFHRHLDGFKVLCLANEACLSDEQVEAVKRFVRGGGGLIATHETSLYDENGTRRVDFALADVLGVRYVRTLPAGERSICFDGSHTVTRSITVERPAHDAPHLVVHPTTGRAVGTLVGPDVDGDKAPAVVVNGYGAGRVVYVPGRLDAIQCERPTPAIERLFAGAVRWAAHGRVPVELTAPAPIAVTLFDQPKRRILHLVNLNGDTAYRHDRIDPVQGIRVQLGVPDGRRVRQLCRLWDEADLPFQIEGDHVHFALDRIGPYEVVSAELEGP